MAWWHVTNWLGLAMRRPLRDAFERIIDDFHPRGYDLIVFHPHVRHMVAEGAA